jgi:hypothetical protein
MLLAFDDLGARYVLESLGSAPDPVSAARLSTARSVERLRGPVHWGRTLSLRMATGAPNIYVTTPAERVYQTPENELLVHVLDAIVQIARQIGWEHVVSTHGPAHVIQTHVAESERWLQNRMVSSIERVPPTARSLARIESGRMRDRYALVVATYRRLVALVDRIDREAIRIAIEEAGLVTAIDSTLFELHTTFKVVDALNALGWQLRPFYLFRGKVRSHGQQADGRQIDLSYQTLPVDLGQGSKYRSTLAAHGFRRQADLRPDLVLRWIDTDGKTRRLLIECKLSVRSGVSYAARQALTDLLAYRQAFEAALN